MTDTHPDHGQAEATVASSAPMVTTRPSPKILARVIALGGPWDLGEPPEPIGPSPLENELQRLLRGESS